MSSNGFNGCSKIVSNGIDLLFLFYCSHHHGYSQNKVFLVRSKTKVTANSLIMLIMLIKLVNRTVFLQMLILLLRSFTKTVKHFLVVQSTSYQQQILASRALQGALLPPLPLLFLSRCVFLKNLVNHANFEFFLCISQQYRQVLDLRNKWL